MSVTPGSAAPADEQQAQLLQCLRAAGGRPVSFEELRSLGIENPAVLCYELDLIGVPIARVNRYVAPGRAVPVGVRIDESAPADYAVEPKTPRWQRRLRRQPSEPPEPPPARRQPSEPPEPPTARLQPSEPPEPPAARLQPSEPPEPPAARRQPSEPPAARRQPLSSALPTIRRRASEAGRLAREQFESARAKGPSLAGGKGADLAGAEDASSAGGTGASSAAGNGASFARAKGTSLAAAAAPIVARAGRHRGLIALIAVGAAAAAVLAIVLANQPGGGTGTSTAGALRNVRGALIPSGRATSRSTRAPGPSAPPGESRQLQAEGHQLLGEERYGAAIADLRAAVARSGESTARCVEANTEACLTYAYALFDLGRALRLNGDRSGAVAALSERLRINDQRGTVQEELSQAREGGGASGPAAK